MQIEKKAFMDLAVLLNTEATGAQTEKETLFSLASLFLNNGLSISEVNDLISLRVLLRNRELETSQLASLETASIVNSALKSKNSIYSKTGARTKNIAYLLHAIATKSTNPDEISPEVEAVQIEWISNGILVRGKGGGGAFCNYYRDTSQFISQSVGSRAIQFVKDKEPKVGDTCILYFGMSDEASE